MSEFDEAIRAVTTVIELLHELVKLTGDLASQMERLEERIDKLESR